jgi:hypothetical protein
MMKKQNLVTNKHLEKLNQRLKRINVDWLHLRIWLVGYHNQEWEQRGYIIIPCKKCMKLFCSYIHYFAYDIVCENCYDTMCTKCVTQGIKHGIKNR